MSEVQAPENNSLDPRWITLRASRINLGITIAGVLLAFPVIWLIRDLPLWVLISLIFAFTLSVAFDLRLILLKDRNSVEAFYLFDLDLPMPPPAEASKVAKAKTDGTTPKLGIRIKFANVATHPASVEREGTVLPNAFVSPWFTALRYHLSGDPGWRRFWPRVIPLWRDGLDPQEFRKIRVMLKWK